MNRSVIPTVLATLIIGIVLGRILGSPSQTMATKPESDVTELCRVIKREQIIHSPRGYIRVAILQRGNGEMRTLYLHPFSGRENIITQSLPAECDFVYASWSDTTPKLEVSSIVPLYPKE